MDRILSTQIKDIYSTQEFLPFLNNIYLDLYRPPISPQFSISKIHHINSKYSSIVLIYIPCYKSYFHYFSLSNFFKNLILIFQILPTFLALFNIYNFKFIYILLQIFKIKTISSLKHHFFSGNRFFLMIFYFIFKMNR